MSNEKTTIAKKLRKNQTSQETKLWSVLRRKNFFGLKFRRQYPIGNYIVDFCCPEKKFILEVDGGGHNERQQAKKDQLRDSWLREQGFTVLRIWNNELEENFEGVIEKVKILVKK